MPSFNKNATGVRPPFGKNQYLRSTKGMKFESATLAAGTVVAETVDGVSMKIAQSGEVLAKITSGVDIGKVGPFQATVTDGRQTAANIVGILETFLPWELNERDAEVSYVYGDAAVVQAWCFERNAAGARIPLSNATRDAILALPGLSILFK
jgi:hypothetical protein